jgi:putative transposase
VKRSILTDGRGVPVGILIAPANWHDTKLLFETIRSIRVNRPRPTHSKPQHLCLDKAYDADWIRKLLSRYRFTPHIPAREYHKRKSVKKGKHQKKKKPRRWVVERSHSWLNRYRGILIRWEKKPKYYRSLMHIASGVICFKHSGME